MVYIVLSCFFFFVFLATKIIFLDFLVFWISKKHLWLAGQQVILNQFSFDTSLLFKISFRRRKANIYAWKRQVIFSRLCFRKKDFPILLVYTLQSGWLKPEASQLSTFPFFMLFFIFALSRCGQACNAAKREKKRCSRRQVRCNFNLKLKALSQLVSN